MEHINPAIVNRIDTRSSRPCDFCREFDPRFLERSTPDQMVATGRRHTASAHLTENGYVRHRVLEISRITSRRAPSTAA
ncbi:MAG: hypothetical protein LAO56_22700 [Acidobacteriia bacterium]|jgi:hypothetical protein|nr:hypothetical protein [Terriglobia bacterium]